MTKVLRGGVVMMRKTRVDWNDEVCGQIAARAAEIRATLSPNDPITVSGLIGQAQTELLPESLRMSAATIKGAHWSKRMLSAIEAHGLLNPLLIQPPPPLSEGKPIQAEGETDAQILAFSRSGAVRGPKFGAEEAPNRSTTAPDRADQEDSTLPDPVGPPDILLREATLEQLQSAQADRMMQILRSDLKRYVDNMIQEGLDYLSPNDLTQKITGERKTQLRRRSCPRILIVGLLPVQMHILKKQCEDADINVDLRFWKDEDRTRLHQFARWSDHTFVMTSFISHDTQNVLRKTPGVDIHSSNGSVSELFRQLSVFLHERYGEDVAPTADSLRYK